LKTTLAALALLASPLAHLAQARGELRETQRGNRGGNVTTLGKGTVNGRARKPRRDGRR
jgi:hypothetical protein